MRRDITDKTCSLAGTSDLTVTARIKPGLVPSLDAVTYKTRVKRVLKALHLSRTLAHEGELARVMSDAVERVGRIHSVRIAVLEPEDVVLLAVTFDGAWQAYVRVIWQKVARLLDLIFCNTEGYVLGGENSYEEWARWLRSAQATTSFLYAVPGLTAEDTKYLRMQERLVRRQAGADLDVAGLSVPSAEEIADTLYKEGTDPSNGGANPVLSVDVAGRPAFRQGLRTLLGLHRLIDVYPERSPDGRVLRSAARELLPEFVRMRTQGGSTYDVGWHRARERFDEAVRWFEGLIDDPLPRERVPPALPSTPAFPPFTSIQGGILEAYADVDHGCLLLVAFESPRGLAKLLDPSVLPVTSHAAASTADFFVNIAFTLEGLRLAGLSDSEIECLPQEFVQGMERRAGLLGDVRSNHPSRWNLPVANWSQGPAASDPARDDPAPRVSLGAVHVVLQLRLPARTASKAPATPPRQLLMTELQRLQSVVPEMRPLSIQWMDRFKSAGKVVEHFNYQDSDTQPGFDSAKAGRLFANVVHVGEALRGHANAADHAPAPPSPGSVEALLNNGSFLVVRKLRQDLEVFDTLLGNAVSQAAASANPAVRALTADDMKARMMGRWPDGHPKAGEPLARFVPGHTNDFRYHTDPNGAMCPLHAHIRRANPRTFIPHHLKEQMQDGSRPARLFRRSMPYGPRHVPNPADPAATAASLGAERGLMFMAYNADIGEQFEVVQRWLVGGNSSSGYSGESDPFVGVAEPGRQRYFRFQHGGEVVRMALDGSDRMHEEPRPLVRLEWGMYLFTPSMQALDTLKARASLAKPSVPWRAIEGVRHLQRLREIEAREGSAAAATAWKAALEDADANADHETASIFAAIREYHHGVLRTPFGVLAASGELVDEVLLDPHKCLTATGYMPRMQNSFGGIYLGMDDGAAYRRESADCNAAIMGLDAEATFALARQATDAKLKELVANAIQHATDDEEARWELTVDVRELVDELLAVFCETWFGLSTDGNIFNRHGYRRDWKAPEPPDYPGHFIAPSRYFFQPHPGAEVERVGSEHGAALLDAMHRLLGASALPASAPVSAAILKSAPASTDPSYAARTIVGAIMGFVPTVDGNLRRLIQQWVREDTLGALRTRYAGSPAADLKEASKRLLAPVIDALQAGPVPDLLWRTAIAKFTLGKDPTGHDNVHVQPGDVVIAALASATQESAAGGLDGHHRAFGGARSAAPSSGPTHACPGRNAALAMMLGFLSAVVEAPHKWRPGAAALTLSVDGLTGLPFADGVAKRSTSSIQAAAFGVKAAVTPLLVLGDSWLAPNMSWGSLLDSLGRLGYGAPSGLHFGSAGWTLEDMTDPGLLADIEIALLDAPDPPKALLLGGGGNDVTGLFASAGRTRLHKLLVQNPPAGSDPLVSTEVAHFVHTELAGFYVAILNRLVKATTAPIFIHAYDHPIPDGRSNVVGFNWLKKVFTARGINDAAMARRAMKDLIGELNTMVTSLVSKYGGQVIHLGLAGELAKDPRYAKDYKLLWKNELHANRDGFDVLAGTIAATFKKFGI